MTNVPMSQRASKVEVMWHLTVTLVVTFGRVHLRLHVGFGAVRHAKTIGIR